MHGFVCIPFASRYPVCSATHRSSSAWLYFSPTPGIPKLITSLTLLEGWCLECHTSLDFPFPQILSNIRFCVNNALYWKVGENKHSKYDCSWVPRKIRENKNKSFIRVPLLTALSCKFSFSIPMPKLPSPSTHKESPWLSAVISHVLSYSF